MPGIIGCLSNTGTTKELLLARKMMAYSRKNKDDKLYEDAFIRCTRTHLNVVGEKKTPVNLKHILAWVEGEFYNIDQLKVKFQLQAKSEGEILLEAYLRQKLPAVLKSIDGYFCAVIYDSKKCTITLITDRYGIKPLYLWEKNGQLVYGSELKCFLSFSSFIPKVRTSSIAQFLSFGHLSGSNTWFEDVVLLDASTLLTYDIKEERIIQKIRYWSWTEIKSVSISSEEAVSRLVELLNSAVDKRTKNISCQHEFSLSLSGGLDSRAILGAIEEGENINAYTFGHPNSDDVRMAKQVAKQFNLKHHIFELNKNNWLNKRIEGIWRCDGAINCIHLHATQFQETISSISKISLNGFAGDLVMGGSWIRHCDQRISRSTIQDIIGLDDMINIEDPFFNINKEDPFFIDFRVRRFTAVGMQEIKEFENRLPFMDNDLMEFVYSLPDTYRYKNKLYTALLLNAFPKLFSGIPVTGFLHTFQPERNYYNVVLNQIDKIWKKLGWRQTDFAQYKSWTKLEMKTFSSILIKDESIIKNFFRDKKFISNCFLQKDPLKIMRLLSMEIWFQQVFNQKYLKTEELNIFYKDQKFI